MAKLPPKVTATRDHPPTMKSGWPSRFNHFTRSGIRNERFDTPGYSPYLGPATQVGDMKTSEPGVYGDPVGTGTVGGKPFEGISPVETQPYAPPSTGIQPIEMKPPPPTLGTPTPINFGAAAAAAMPAAMPAGRAGRRRRRIL